VGGGVLWGGLEEWVGGVMGGGEGGLGGCVGWRG